jgi:hypothetical protein
VVKAWDIFSKDPKYKNHFQNAVNGNDDAETGDVFLQLTVLGDVIFG